MDCIIHRVTKSQTRLSDFHFLLPCGSVGNESACQRRRHGFDPWVWEDPLEDGMATHSRVLAWKVPGTVEPGGLPSMGSHRIRHD